MFKGKFREGRQGTGYKTWTFFSKRVSIGKLHGIDSHLIVYEPGSYIPPHLDKLKAGFDHYRLNLVVIPSRDGGKFKSDGHIFNFKQRIILFRPDIQVHYVTRCVSKRVVLSVGWSIKTK